MGARDWTAWGQLLHTWFPIEDCVCTLLRRFVPVPVPIVADRFETGRDLDGIRIHIEYRTQTMLTLKYTVYA